MTDQTNAPTTTDELLAVDYDLIEYAKVRLKRGDPAEYEGGRVVGRFKPGGLVLRYRGHEVRVTQVSSYTLDEISLVPSGHPRRLIEAGWDE
jgi:hypothetical protein